ncbi:putative uncharacterized protein CXorf58 homolog [Gracilinanus agilis]|uniref:putative uncharacterized protein CXorf58 homolog n=1 Tax=Gracilinanus agilis TaxID=191870 RepID=UPI001CFD1A70|nr:putative uncharacterized protein CXorf58 homolog [Gracilinanus agilis]
MSSLNSEELSRNKKKNLTDFQAVNLPDVIPLHDLKAIEKTQAAQVIQRAWFSHMDRMMFQLLKHTICAAENCVTYEILKKVCPLEADLVKDPSVQCKVRFRFGGKTFPPFIVFKIFLHTGGHGNKYFSGKNTLRPSSEAVVDACKIMGNRKYYDQIIQDQLEFQRHKIADEVDVVTMKDYMHFTSFLDETPAYLGGKSNCWRKLSLENIPKTMIIYDIMNYATSGTLSDRLQKELKYLLQKPKSVEMQRDQLWIVSKIRSSSPSSISVSSLQKYYQQQLTKPNQSGRRTKRAQLKIAKMRKAYQNEKEKNMEESNKQKRNEKDQHRIVIITPSYELLGINSPASDDELEQEAKELFSWSKQLCLDNS